MEVLLRNCINTAALLCMGTVMVYGQVDLSKYELGVNLSTYVYEGDLTPSSIGSFKTSRFGLMIYANRKINSAFSLRTNLAFGSLKGDDEKYADPSWRQQRNFSFKSPIFEVSELLTWNILGNNSERGLGGFSPYLFGGIGFSFLNITRDVSRYNAEYFANEPHVQEGLLIDFAKPLPKAIPVFPVGLGIRYSLNSKFSVLAESSYRITTTDYLDGFSQSANAARKDQYGSYSLGLIYKFAGKNNMDCPPVVK